MSQGLPTIAQVARQAGVSPQTVSNVLNNPGIVRDDTRMRVQTVIDELGYRPNAAARRLRTRQSATIGVRIDPVTTDGVSDATLDRFLHELTQGAEAKGLRVMLFTARDPLDEITQYQRLRDSADVDAVVVTSTVFDDPRLEWLSREGLPFVAFGRPWGNDLDDPSVRWVDVDGRAGLRQATAHLARRGLGTIGYLGWPSGSGTGDDRRLGWIDACAELGLAADVELVSEDRVPIARAAVQRLIDAGSEVEGLVCASDTLALGAMMAVRESGRVHFPVIGFDNTPVARAVGMSSVDQSFAEVSRAVLDLLDQTSTDSARHRLIAPRLIVRRSNDLASPTPTIAPV